jgi:hypothetical protein
MESTGDALLRERLAALPLETPPAAAWATIRSELEQRAQPQRAPQRRSPWWLALAAAIATAAIVPGLQTPAPAPTEATVAASPELAALMQRSRLLESEIRELRASAAGLAESQFDWESAIENDLALVDVGLAARGDGSESLWRERVRLLEELRTAAQMDTGPLLLQARLD